MNDNVHWLHTVNWAGYFAHPVDLLSRGKTFCRVRLRHKTRLGRVDYPAGTIKARVPNHSVTDAPMSIAYKSVGGGRFK